jgi:TRAP-type mannitol/chloroaromatic compound transport system substrate-binding protein
MAAASTIPGPALAGSTPDVHWKLTSAFHPSLDFISGGARVFAQALSEMTEGHFTLENIALSSGNASAAAALDAVSAGKAGVRPYRALPLLE